MYICWPFSSKKKIKYVYVGLYACSRGLFLLLTMLQVRAGSTNFSQILKDVQHQRMETEEDKKKEA
jgi:hypothetical protein